MNFKGSLQRRSFSLHNRVLDSAMKKNSSMFLHTKKIYSIIKFREEESSLLFYLLRDVKTLKD